MPKLKVLYVIYLALSKMHAEKVKNLLNSIQVLKK